MEINYLSPLYKSLLNRNPNGNEILKFMKHRNIKIVNKEILFSDEYKNFLSQVKKNINELIRKIFFINEVSLTIHPMLEYIFIDNIRKNNYCYNNLEYELTKLFKEYDPKIKVLINKLYFNRQFNKEEPIIENSRIILLTNNFNLNELEFDLVSDPNYLKMVKSKLKNM